MPGRAVLVTGMSGLIGRALRKQLEGHADLRALNRGAVEGVPCHRADIGDLEAIAPAFEGVDTVVHLAADATSPNPPWESILHNNVTGTYNVYEAARRAKVKRVVGAPSDSWCKKLGTPGVTASVGSRKLPRFSMRVSRA